MIHIKKIAAVIILLCFTALAQNNAAETATDNESTVEKRMSDIMPPVRFTRIYTDIYVDSAKIDVSIEWTRLNTQFLYELIANEQEVRNIIIFVAKQKLFYDMRYNETRFRNELINALNNYFKHGRAEKIKLSGWPS